MKFVYIAVVIAEYKGVSCRGGVVDDLEACIGVVHTLYSYSCRSLSIVVESCRALSSSERRRRSTDNGRDDDDACVGACVCDLLIY